MNAHALWTRLAATLTLGSAGAFAQTVLFSDNFESGLSNWTAETGWHIATSAAPCLATSLPFPSGTHVAWFGSESTCNFDPLPWDFQDIALAQSIALPAGAAQILLEFRSKSAGEDDAVWDRRDVYVSTNDGVTWTNERRYFSSPWRGEFVDLSHFAGQSIRVKFTFWVGDWVDNDHLGWLLDDVVIRTGIDSGTVTCTGDNTGLPCPCSNFGATGNGCATSFNPAGAHLAASGVASVSADTLSLSATGTSDSVVTYLQGTAFYSPWFGYHGDGLLCAAAPVLRIGSIPATVGASTYPRPGDPLISVRGSAAVGQARLYQVRFRNAAAFCTTGTFNMTNGIEVRWRL